MQRANHYLKTVYGYSEFRLHQAEIIQTLLAGGDAMTLMPTGGGKSICYQIPSMILDGVGIIISPLIALMQDQVTQLKQLGVKAAFINSTLSFNEVQKIQADLVNANLDLLYLAPERLLTSSMLALLAQSKIALFAIDEAHCVSQWGHDFRKEYQQLSILHQRFPTVPRIALTATADQRTQNEIVQQLGLGKARVFVNSFNRPNITYSINDGQQLREQLWKFIKKNHPHDAGIIYCLSRKKVESTAEWFSKKGRVALPYHAGLSDKMRQQHQQRFLCEDGIIIVATIAFGMGIDKPNVRFVGHLNLPKSIEAYYQETGRAGRDGEPANAWLGYGLQDVITLNQMIHVNDGNDTYKRIAHQKLEAMIGLCELNTCRRQTLLAYFGEPINEPCGNCDNCNDPPQTWDATTAAQKALSCVYRTGQRFGTNYVIDVLLGKEDKRILQNRHNQLSTYGIGKDLSNIEWRTIFRQLIIQGYLYADADSYNVITLTKLARPVLRGETTIILRSVRRAGKGNAKNKSTDNKYPLNTRDESLLETLKDLRLKLSKKQSVPAYHVFHDATLIQMATIQPTTLVEMGSIHGIGEKKLKRYGQLFIDAIQQTLA